MGCRLFCLQDHVFTKAGGAAVIADGKAFPEIGQPGTTNRYLTLPCRRGRAAAVAARLSSTAAGLPVEGLKPAFIALHRAIVLALPKELSACAQADRGLSTPWGLQPIAAAGSSRAARQVAAGRPCRAVPYRAGPGRAVQLPRGLH